MGPNAAAAQGTGDERCSINIRSDVQAGHQLLVCQHSQAVEHAAEYLSSCHAPAKMPF